ncbi:MAG: V-type ATPase subunit [Clostridia bacterium]|nr:V-type ATPase subunit [Clostridia bacterium]
MPNDSTLYAVARIRTLEKGLVDGERLRRMAAAPLPDAMRLLCETGYGAIPDAGSYRLEEMITYELERAYRDVRELTSDPAATDVFILKNDVLTLKTLLKLRELGAELKPEAARTGLFSTDALRAMVETGDYGALPAALAAAAEELEFRLALRFDPEHISTALDRGYCAHGQENGDPVVREYFRAFCDYTNLLTALRLRRAGSGADALERRLLCSGEIPAEHFIKHYEQPPEALVRSMPFGDARNRLIRAVDDMLRDGSLARIELRRDDYLMSLFSVRRWESESIYPIIGYLLARESEAKAIRLVITLKRIGATEGAILERLRALYVQG